MNTTATQTTAVAAVTGAVRTLKFGPRGHQISQSMHLLFPEPPQDTCAALHALLLELAVETQAVPAVIVDAHHLLAREVSVLLVTRRVDNHELVDNHV